MIARFLQTLTGAPEMDAATRTLTNVTLATTGVAGDGKIILPEGMVLKRWLAQPIVTDRHTVGMRPSDKPLVVARALDVRQEKTALRSKVQFADTEAGREFAYLYGINPEKEVYMRSFSVEGPILETSTASWDQARAISAEYWEPTLAERLKTKLRSVEVATRFEMYGVAAVAIGADRGALARAMENGVATAGALIARLDLGEAEMTIADLKTMLGGHDKRLAECERQIQAMRGDGASAAARGDSEAVLNAVREMAEAARTRNAEGGMRK